MKSPIVIFWFRRDLRLDDNHGLYHALQYGVPVLPLFIFDTDILNKLEDNRDARVGFIHKKMSEIHHQLTAIGSGLYIGHGSPVVVFEHLLSEYNIEAVFTNHDYEPYGLYRDNLIIKLLQSKNVAFKSFKDQVVFEKDEVVKSDGKPFTVFTPYANKWKQKLSIHHVKSYPSEKLQHNFLKIKHDFPKLSTLGFLPSTIEIKPLQITNDRLAAYASSRDYPAEDATSYAGTHLRFGTISVRKLVSKAISSSETYLNELIWREFFMQILWHFPHVVSKNFNPKYDRINWRNNENEFKLWCEGRTGYPMVDAGMRQLNQSGFMHNRVRMVAASFLCKHLLIDWRWGEAYFAARLNDYELASNNGNWQWAAGTGCDAAPYFRVFNPEVQAKKFDPTGSYIRKYIPELNTPHYPSPMVEHKFARNRAIQTYKHALSGL